MLHGSFANNPPNNADSTAGAAAAAHKLHVYP